MALIISILISLGIVNSADQVTAQIIQDHQTEINAYIILDEELE